MLAFGFFSGALAVAGVGLFTAHGLGQTLGWGFGFLLSLTGFSVSALRL